LLSLERRIDKSQLYVKGILPQNVVLDTDGHAGDGIIFRNRMLEKNLQGFPGAAAEGGNELPVVKKIPAENLRNTEYEMPVGYIFEDVHAEPLPEFHYALLMAGETE